MRAVKTEFTEGRLTFNIAKMQAALTLPGGAGRQRYKLRRDGGSVVTTCAGKPFLLIYDKGTPAMRPLTAQAYELARRIELGRRPSFHNIESSGA